MKQTRLHHVIAKNPDLRGEYTVSDIQNNIAQYGAKIRGIETHNRLEWIFDGQEVDISHWPKRVQGDLSKVKIIDDQKDFVVLFKPAGVVVHPGAGHKTGTLFDWILEHIPGQTQLLADAPEDSNARHSAGLVHRLDKDTAGLILVAKTLESHQRLQDLFRERKVQKKYLAVLSGKLETEVRVEGWQCRDKRNPRLQKFFEKEVEAHNYDPLARNSVSVFTPIRYDEVEDYTLVEVDIHTGRMHQIRLQATYISHPVINDTIYGNVLKTISCKELQEFVGENDLQLLSNCIGFETYSIELIPVH